MTTPPRAVATDVRCFGLLMGAHSLTWLQNRAARPSFASMLNPVLSRKSPTATRRFSIIRSRPTLSPWLP